jgi:hypothetical protein
MCLSGDTFVSEMGAVRAEESSGFELEKRPPVTWSQGIYMSTKNRFGFFLDSKEGV